MFVYFISLCIDHPLRCSEFLIKMYNFYSLCNQQIPDILYFFFQKCDTSKHKVLVVSVCPQSLPYFAAKFNLSVTDASRRLCGFLKSLGESSFDKLEMYNLSL